MHYQLRADSRSVALSEGVAVVVGRSGAAEIVLEHPSVSRLHARFVLENGRVCVEDLQSRNGVYVNGARIAGSAVLQAGDRIAIGEAVLTLDTAHGSTLPTEPPPLGSTLPPPGVTAPLVVSPRMHLDHATAAVDMGSHDEALRAFGDFILAVEGEHARGTDVEALVAEATIALIHLGDQTNDVRPLELLLRLRRVTELPLASVTTEEIAGAIAQLPRGPQNERAAYCAWLRGRPASFTERLAAQRLEEA